MLQSYLDEKDHLQLPAALPTTRRFLRVCLYNNAKSQMSSQIAKRPPCLRPQPHQRGYQELRPPPVQPRPPVPPTSCGSILLPLAHFPPADYRAPCWSNSGKPAAFPSSLRLLFLPAGVGETALPLPTRSSAR